MKKEVAIVIPIYKEELSELEKISLLQMTKIFENYDKFFVMPFSLKKYHIVKEIKRIWFDDKWFKSSSCYSRLLMNTKFYEVFEQYKYILIYQLDAFVFEDKLEYFCNLDYDYIGAPWLSGFQYFLDREHVIWHVGNGGFSLRNVSKCIELIKKRGYLFTKYVNEDMFFSVGNSDDFNVAPLKIALEFSFEREVRRCFEYNAEKLPFGCHAWERYDIKFWKPYIESYGYKIDEKYLFQGNEDKINRNTYKQYQKDAYFWKYIFSKKSIERIMNKKGKIYIWGAGERGTKFGKLLSGIEINIAGYLDNNPQLVGTYIENYEVFSLKDYEEDIRCAYVIIATDLYRNEIASYLNTMGRLYNKDYIFYTDIYRILIEDYYEVNSGNNFMEIIENNGIL